MLAIRVHGAHFGRLGDQSREACMVIFLHQIAIKLLQSMDIALILSIKHGMVFQHRNSYMPEVKMLAKVL
jgi:hypothetical protein